MKTKCHKRIGLITLRDKDVVRLENVILRLGYDGGDYKINYFNESRELIVVNTNLYRDLKVIRKI